MTDEPKISQRARDLGELLDLDAWGDAILEHQLLTIQQALDAERREARNAALEEAVGAVVASGLSYVNHALHTVCDASRALKEKP